MKNKSRVVWLAGTLGALVSAAIIESTHAQSVRPDANGARMDISGYAFEGRYLLDAEDFTRIVAPLIGRQKTAADIERARSALQRAYHDLGYCEVEITLAHPGPVDGVVRFRSTESPPGNAGNCLPKSVRLAEQATPGPLAQAEPAKPAAAAVERAAGPAPRFDIRGYQVTGNTLLPAAALEDALAPHAGPDREYGDIQRALETLEQAYRDLGYGVVQVLLPEQDITQGVVRFRVVEPRVGKVAIEGNAHFDDGNIRRSLPTVKEGETPNSKAIARNLQLAGEHPVKQTNVLLRAGASEGEIDLTVKVTDDKPWRGFITLDNTGTNETGVMRLGIGAQHANLFNRDHVITVQYVTSPSDPQQVAIYGVGYRVPFYGLNSSLDVVLGYSDVDSGVVQGLFNVSGSGSIAIVRWNTILPKLGDLEQKISFGLDYRAFQNDVQFQGSASIVPDITIRPASLNYGGLWRGAATEFSFYGNYSKNIPGGENGREEDWRAQPGSRQTVVDNYQITRYGFNFVSQFSGEWQVRLGASGQYTSDALISGEQFGIGGPDTVRGYLLRELAKDRGYAAQLEFYTPELARPLGMAQDFRMRFLAFYDYGSVENNETQPSDRQSLASTGAGLRLGYSKAVSLRFDVARILKEAPEREKDSYRVSAALALIF